MRFFRYLIFVIFSIISINSYAEEYIYYSGNFEASSASAVCDLLISANNASKKYSVLHPASPPNHFGYCQTKNSGDYVMNGYYIYRKIAPLKCPPKGYPAHVSLTSENEIPLVVCQPKGDKFCSFSRDPKSKPFIVYPPNTSGSNGGVSRPNIVMLSDSDTPVSVCYPRVDGKCNPKDPYGGCFSPDDNCTRQSDGSIICPDDSPPPIKPTCSGADYCDRPPQGCGEGYVSGNFNGKELCVKSDKNNGSGGGSEGGGSEGGGSEGGGSEGGGSEGGGSEGGGSEGGGSEGGGNPPGGTDLKGVISAINEVVRSINHARNELNTSISRVKDEIIKSNTKLDKVNSNLEDLNSNVKKVDSSLNNLNSNIGTVNNNLETINDTLNTKLDKANSTLDKINNKPSSGNGSNNGSDDNNNSDLCDSSASSADSSASSAQPGCTGTDLKHIAGTLDDIKKHLTDKEFKSKDDFSGWGTSEVEIKTAGDDEYNLNSNLINVTASCPPPLQIRFTLLREHVISMSYETMCYGAGLARPWIILSGSIIAFLIIAGSYRGSSDA